MPSLYAISFVVASIKPRHATKASYELALIPSSAQPGSSEFPKTGHLGLLGIPNVLRGRAETPPDWTIPHAHPHPDDIAHSHPHRIASATYICSFDSSLQFQQKPIPIRQEISHLSHFIIIAKTCERERERA